MKWYSIAHALEFLGDLLGENALRDLVKAHHIKAQLMSRGKAESVPIYKISENELKRFSKMIEQSEGPLEFRDKKGKIIVEFTPTNFLKTA